MPLESKWAEVPDEDNFSVPKTKTPRVSRPKSRREKHQPSSFDDKHDHHSNMMGGHQIGFAPDMNNKSRSTSPQKKSRSSSPQKKKSPTSRPTTSSSLEGRIMPNFTDERESISPERTKSPSPMNENGPSKMELLKKKIAEQRRIREALRKEQQQKLLDDFLNDDSLALNWEDDDEEDDKLLERISKLKV